ncbi:low molecular weight phosphotyrosine protein phosphatase 1-like [Schistocerca nitens]|uniref:low molecular weight phosphotyrosine protein phosphatase 1-like n=1 Tax=Schistocerca nitens TaxID=7011 RepID=UPI002118D1A0|nr:low molecular weight phosphotyrosine protein phosphatase 1-like [Schistocerca nitens]
MSSEKKAVLFICLGNICRSPIAEAVFLNLLKQRGLTDKWIVDSAAIGPWHVGKAPDKRARSTLEANGIDYKHTVRQIRKDDFNQFDYIFGMDDENMENLKHQAPAGSKAQLQLVGAFDPKGERIIRDPYYDSDDKGFHKCYEQCVRSLSAFLDQQSK